MHRLFAGRTFRAAIQRPAGKRHTGCGIGMGETSREGKHSHCHNDQRDQDLTKNAHELNARSSPQGLQRSSNGEVTRATQSVCFWHLTDIVGDAQHVRFQG